MIEYRCVTTWRDDEGNSFDRVHNRHAPTPKAALAAEEEHAAERMAEGMEAEGWKPECRLVSP